MEVSINAPISCEWLESDTNVAVFGFEPNLKNIDEIKGNILDNSQDTLYLTTTYKFMFSHIRFFLLKTNK